MDINFCNNCDNLLFLYTNDDNKLYYGCKVCGNIQDYIEKKKIYKSADSSISEIINTNKNIVNDITLPRINNENIKCINSECPSIVKNKPNNILYIKYDADNLKFMYICENCGKKWNNS